MKTKTVEFEVKKNPYTGVVLPKVVKVKFDISQYEEKSEIPPTKMLDDDQYVGAVNAKDVAVARNREQTKALKAAGIERPEANDAAVILASQRKNLKLQFPHFTDEQIDQVLEGQAKLAASIAAMNG